MWSTNLNEINFTFQIIQKFLKYVIKNNRQEIHGKKAVGRT